MLIAINVSKIAVKYTIAGQTKQEHHKSRNIAERSVYIYFGNKEPEHDTY